jgi:probable phosphoglycerate mutase
MTAQALKFSNTLRLYLFRHGETAWSISGQHTGRTDIPLTGHGEDEARQLGARLQSISFTHVLCSPLQRARQTCALAGLGQAPEIEADLIEWNYGVYEGRTSLDILNERPDWSIFRDGCPQGETPADVLARSDRLIGLIRLLHGNVALFTHGQLGGVLAARWIGLPLAAAQHFPLATASLSVLGYDQHHPGVAVIETWNAKAMNSF